MLELGIDRLLEEASFIRLLKGRRVGLVAHPASVTANLSHSLEAMLHLGEFNITCGFGPQHGMRGEKQDNMIESETYVDNRANIPIFSLYGELRRPSKEMLEYLDVIIVDLQDVGCRIYTFLTTLFYLLEEAAIYKKQIWVLDRPNPAGRPIEGLKLKKGWESFVGLAPMPMRHGLTLGEAAKWFVSHSRLDVDLRVIEMRNYRISQMPGFGWPANISWVNPSPNMPRLTTARSYAGTVLVEGTQLSEGRGTTIPLEVFGAPDIDAEKILGEMKKRHSPWLRGCALRPCFFEPTFQKHKGKLCSGIQIHPDSVFYDHLSFQPFRVVALFFKSLRRLYPDYDLWRQPPYEYEAVKKPIDILAGSQLLREWVDDQEADPEDLEKFLSKDETEWLEESKPFHLYE
jgi:uncharacterized protein YbbC (DUF1343 family)